MATRLATLAPKSPAQIVEQVQSHGAQCEAHRRRRCFLRGRQGHCAMVTCVPQRVQISWSRQAASFIASYSWLLTSYILAFLSQILTPDRRARTAALGPSQGLMAYEGGYYDDGYGHGDQGGAPGALQRGAVARRCARCAIAPACRASQDPSSISRPI